VVRAALPTLEELRALKLAELAGLRWVKETGGTTYNGMPVATDAVSQTNRFSTDDLCGRAQRTQTKRHECVERCCAGQNASGEVRTWLTSLRRLLPLQCKSTG